MHYLIKQAVFLPLLFFSALYISASMVDGYSHIAQHGSEITITEFETAKTILNTGAILTGVSCILLALGVVLQFRKYALTSLLLSLFGISMVSNGLYPTGSPMHGFYGMGMVLMILPFMACYELKNENLKPLFFRISLICGALNFIYLWSVFVGLDPADYRGLTQRIASVFIFGWIAIFAYQLNRKIK